ncbi:MAG TPA: aquaporin [Anaerolineales bacterium]|jgi:MIP family channel proteins
MDARKLTAEFIGTFALVFIGAGAAAVGVGGVVGVGLAHGLILTAVVYAWGGLSGAHVNPAVTFGVWLRGKIETGLMIGYWLAQLFGGVVAGLLLAFVLPDQPNQLGATVLADGVTPVAGFVLEAVFTFFLATTVLRAAVRGQAGQLAGVAIGLTLAASILMGGPLTGASLNPARTLGPAVAAGQFADIWLYFAGPLAGGALAALVDWQLGE